MNHSEIYLSARQKLNSAQEEAFRLIRRAFRVAVEQCDYSAAAEYAYALGIRYRSTGKTSSALREFRRALKCNSQFIPAIMGIAGILVDRGKTRTALSYYERAAELGEDGAKYYLALQNEGLLTGFRDYLSEQEWLSVKERVYERLPLSTVAKHLDISETDVVERIADAFAKIKKRHSYWPNVISQQELAE